MKAFDSSIEAKIAKSICDSPERNLILSGLGADYFGYDPAREIYQRIITLIASGKQVPSSSILSADDALSKEAQALISNPNNECLSKEEDIQAAVGLMAKYRKARLLLLMTQQIVDLLRQADPDVDAAVQNAEQILSQCHSGQATQEMFHLSAQTADVEIQRLKKHFDTPDQDLVQSGFLEFDKKSGGVRKGQVLVLASTPGGGKSVMMECMAANQYLMGHNVAVVSFEMQEVELKYRLLANITRTDHSDLNLNRLSSAQKGHILSAYEDFLKSSKQGNRFTIWTPDRPLNIPEIATQLKPYNYDVIYIDYISLLKTHDKKAMWESLGDHARDAKMFAKNLKTVLVLLAQYDSDEEKIKYSRAIEANADFIWGWANGPVEKESGVVEIRQSKARGAEQYPFLLQREFKYMRFYDYHGPRPTAKNPQGPMVAPPPNSPPPIPKMPELLG